MIVGRQNEIKLLNEILSDGRSHFVAVYGRRRVGKTFLIRETYGNRFTFQHAGLSNGSFQEQMTAFESSLKDAGADVDYKVKNWLFEFEKLKDLIRKSTEQKKIIFIDELSWMDTPKSDLITALESFWNGWASARNDIILIVCASATSWMLSKVIHSKGGLYNRLTEEIHLEPFYLYECEEYIRANNINIQRGQILQYYMIFGGIPFYWSFIKRGLSLSQNIDRILFAPNAPLRDEFKYLYASIFKNPTVYLKIVQTLGQKKVGMTREELIKEAGITNSGDLSTRLEELESCGFIRKYNAFGSKKKNALYQLIDNFTLFYYKFLKDSPTDEHFWTNQINTPVVNTWLGLSFERVCLLHLAQIKKKLGISGVITNTNAWSCKADPDLGLYGSQIDLMIVRKDEVINLCEIKYSGSEYIVTAEFEKNMQHKISDLRTATKTKNAIYPTLITSFGMVENTHSNIIQSVVTMDDLFEKV